MSTLQERIEAYLRDTATTAGAELFGAQDTDQTVQEEEVQHAPGQEGLDILEKLSYK